MLVALKGLIRLAGAAAALALLVAACSSAELTGGAPTATWDDARKTAVAKRNYVPTRTPIPTSTPRVKAAAKSVTINPTASPGPTSTPFPTPTPNPLNSDFAQVLLNVEDLPTGWSAYTASLDIETTPRDTICGVTIQDPAVADIAVDFEKSFRGPYVNQALSLYDSAGNASAVLMESRRAFESCPAEGWVEDDGSFLYLAPLSFPQIGDDSYALRLTIGVDDVVVQADVVIFQVDEVLAAITYATLDDFSSEEFDSAITEEFARLAEAKIRAMSGYIDNLDILSQAI